MPRTEPFRILTPRGAGALSPTASTPIPLPAEEHVVAAPVVQTAGPIMLKPFRSRVTNRRSIQVRDSEIARQAIAAGLGDGHWKAGGVARSYSTSQCMVLVDVNYAVCREQTARDDRTARAHGIGYVGSVKTARDGCKSAPQKQSI